ncbi:MAG: secondary thiamine-phosphate synthase enzyme YjbQ, partial [Candidatus Anammoxibacter sp.]
MNATINVKSLKKVEFIDITREVRTVVEESGIQEGVCYVFVPHTTAAVTINEGADPAVLQDMVAAFDIIAPDEPFFKHAEGNS